MVLPLVVLGAIGTLGGAGVLVLAFRSGQDGDAARERVLFRRAVVALALGSVAFLVAMILGTPRG